MSPTSVISRKDKLGVCAARNNAVLPRGAKPTENRSRTASSMPRDARWSAARTVYRHVPRARATAFWKTARRTSTCAHGQNPRDPECA